MDNTTGKPIWQCISCGETLGHIMGGELQPAVHGEYLMTRGPNLAVRCPKCNTIKTFYTSDPVVRAVYQLVDAISTQMAKRMINQISESTVHKSDK